MPLHVKHEQLVAWAKAGRVIRDLSQRVLPIAGLPKKEKKEQRTAAFRRLDLNNQYFRSSWESNVARYLNWLQSYNKIDHWEYEVDEFEFPVKRGRGKYYKPDFKVWTTVHSFEYWEVKGYLDAISATKLKRMQRYYPEHKVVLIDRYVYYQTVVPLKALLSGWEQMEEK